MIKWEVHVTDAYPGVPVIPKLLSSLANNLYGIIAGDSSGVSIKGKFLFY